MGFTVQQRGRPWLRGGRETLGQWSRRPKEDAIARSALPVVLARVEVDSDSAAAVLLCINRAMVGKGRLRFVEHRLDGLHDGVPRGAQDGD